jgi:hypothetical protein
MTSIKLKFASVIPGISDFRTVPAHRMINCDIPSNIFLHTQFSTGFAIIIFAHSKHSANRFLFTCVTEGWLSQLAHKAASCAHETQFIPNQHHHASAIGLC